MTTTEFKKFLSSRCLDYEAAATLLGVSVDDIAKASHKSVSTHIATTCALVAENEQLRAYAKLFNNVLDNLSAGAIAKADLKL